ncbi:MAG: IS630 family transposase [Geobacteraceae bacterium]|jgi:transposase|nr:MAG: IS630 family transposase [Geobacteraceae bacterium]
MAKKYVVTLQVEEREQLLALIGSGNAKARTLTHARILLKADEGWYDHDICEALNVSVPTVERVRKQFVFEGFEASLKRRRSRRVYRRKVDGEQEAHMVVLACSAPPDGYARWSLRLLADRVVQMKIIDSISHETVRQVLDENELKPWRREEWCIPTANAEFVFHMEDVLDVYKRSADPKRPLVCFDESPEQLVSETRQALPMTPGQLEKYDYEYRREGVSNLFMFFAPLQNWRCVKVTERRTKVDWAYCMRDLVDVHFPQAEKIVIVQDQLNTHSPACLYEVFLPAEAKRILDRLEFHSTPKHGSWLNMAEIELSVLGRQCLNRCIPNQSSLIHETQAWVIQRNNKQATVNWHFTSDDARIKLTRLYPSIDH